MTQHSRILLDSALDPHSLNTDPAKNLNPDPAPGTEAIS